MGAQSSGFSEEFRFGSDGGFRQTESGAMERCASPLAKAASFSHCQVLAAGGVRMRSNAERAKLRHFDARG